MKVNRRIPLLIDHHTHPSFYAALHGCLNLDTVQSKADALSLIRKKDECINVILGWNNRLYSFEKKELDRLPPVLICNVSLHSFLMNRPAKEKLSKCHKEIVDNIEDSHWSEKNLTEINRFIVNLRPCGPERIRAFYAELLKKGVSRADDLLLTSENQFYQLKALGFYEKCSIWADPGLFRSLHDDVKKEVCGIKIFTDGALGAKTAAMTTPFLSGEKGMLLYTGHALYGLIREAEDIKKGVALHAIGDVATDQVISVLEEMHRQTGRIPPSRIEHCQFISPGNARKAKSLGIVLSMQPNFSHDSVQYSDRLPERYRLQNNPFRMLIDEAGFEPGKDLIFGSDGMPHGVEYALKMSLFPPYSSQRLTLDEFIAGYCVTDMENGHIDIEIDEENRTVTSQIIVK